MHEFGCFIIHTKYIYNIHRVITYFLEINLIPIKEFESSHSRRTTIYMSASTDDACTPWAVVITHCTIHNTGQFSRLMLHTQSSNQMGTLGATENRSCHKGCWGFVVVSNVSTSVVLLSRPARFVTPFTLTSTWSSQTLAFSYLTKVLTKQQYPPL